MLSDILKLVDVSSRFFEAKTASQQKVQVLRRVLTLELRTNLNLLTSVVDAMGKSKTDAGLRKDELQWLLKAVSIDAMLAVLALEDYSLESLAETKAEADLKENSLQHLKTLPQALSFIVVKVREMRTLADAPGGAMLPAIRWGVRIKNLRKAHGNAMQLLQAAAIGTEAAAS